MKRRIAAHEVAVGSTLPWDAYDPQGRLLLRRGHMILTGTQIERLVERGLFIEDDPAHERQAIVTREQPLPSAVALVLDARAHLQNACAAADGAGDFPSRILRIREVIREACTISQDVCLAMTLLQHKGRYSIRHAVDVAITAHVVGASLGLSESDLTASVAAALTMNISMHALQDVLQDQKLPLTSDQRHAVQTHPERSARTLLERGVTDEAWLAAVVNHHEAVDGSGYPAKKSEGDIPLTAQIISLADIYCARICSRSYRAPLRPNAALRAIFFEQGKRVSPDLANRFIKAIGIYPIGSAVRLENGEIGVVTHRGANVKTPDVSAVIGPRGLPLERPVKRDTSRPTFAVREVVSWSEAGAEPDMLAIWGPIAKPG
jgi:HD-GYP domain-containing protein (c-di-GMP phosphodiesterase class II)